MTALWIVLIFAAGCLGGWPVTAGILRLAKSRSVRAVDAHEMGAPTPPDAARPDRAALTPTREACPPPAQEAAVNLPPTQEAGVTRTPAQEAAVTLPPTQEDGVTRMPAQETGVLRGGLLIGMLERAGVVLAILSGQPVAIAYVVAIKGLGRYPELKAAPESSERFIIGTLASMLWAAAVAAVAKVLLL